MGINIRSVLENNLLKSIALLIWLAINVYLFVSTYMTYANEDRYHYLYMVLKDSICVSRACAMAINFNCMLILLPMCRTFTSMLRTKICKYFKANPRRLINHMKGFHILCAYTMIILGVIHSLSHLVNCLQFHLNFVEAFTDINVGDTRKQTTLWLVLSTVPGWSGILMLLIVAILVLTSLHSVRRKKYEIFWYTHHLALIFLVLLCIHGLGNITKYQTNLEEHPVECHSLNKQLWKNYTMSHSCKGPPKFESKQAESWIWVIVPFILYVFDRLVRFYRGMKDCIISHVTLHEGKMMEIHLLKKGFKSKPGQYILLQCPTISEFEWHAFTLTKCPTNDGGEETFSVHIKVAGDWTMQLKGLLMNCIDVSGVRMQRVGDSCIININAEGAVLEEEEGGRLPIIRVDGPYGSPNEDCFRYPVNISVAAGIGITPFAAVLNKLRMLDPKTIPKNFKMERIYVVWACRDIHEFTWFLKLMFDTVKHLNKIGMADLLVCHLYVTRGANLSAEDPSMIDYKIQWLQKRLKYGRPNFEEILKKISLNYYKKRIGVFYCGPGPLGNVLNTSCKKVNYRGNAFIFHKESFA